MKTLKIIYNGFYNHKNKLKIVDELYEKYNWKPVMFLGVRPDTQIIKSINKKYSSCITNDSMDLRHSKFDYSKFDIFPIDKDILNSISNYTLNAISSYPDPNGKNFIFEDRKNYFYEILKYWNTVINNLKPDIFVSYSMPHTPPCYSLYLLCKNYYNIPTLYVNSIPLLNKNYHFIGTSVFRQDKPFTDINKSNKDFALADDVKSYLSNIRSKDAKMPNHVLKSYKDLKESSKKINIFIEFCKIIIKTLKNGYGFKRDYDYKKKNIPYDDIKSNMNNLEHFFLLLKIARSKKKLKKIYDKYVTKFDNSKKYVYFAAQFQPEATTTQVGSCFENYNLVLELLSSIIPDDWIIYYKENPVIFSRSPKVARRTTRDENYYKKITKLKKIKLVSIETNTFDLIDNAQAVATVTGTAAWEAAVRGVPSISFGNAWYSGCASIFSINNINDAKLAIKKIINGFKPDQRDIEKYANLIFQVSSKKIISGKNFKTEMEKNKNSNEIIKNTAKCFYQEYYRNYVN